MNGFLNKLILGLGLIAVGVIFLANQMNWIQFNLGNFFTVYWPLILIYFGLRGLLLQRSYRRGSFIWSALTMFVGGYFLLRNLGIDGFSYDNMYKFIVPVLFILFGLKILLRSSHPGTPRPNRPADWWGTGYDDRQAKKNERKMMKQQLRDRVHEMKADVKSNYSQWKDSANNCRPYQDDEHKNRDFRDYHGYHNKVNRSSFIGDIHIGQEDWDLTPLNVSLFIGDTIIDLTKANVPMGETKINISSFIGDLKIYLPNDMQIGVSVSASAFISDFKVLDRYESGLFKHLETETRDYYDADKKIRINISTFIGDVIVIFVG